MSLGNQFYVEFFLINFGHLTRDRVTIDNTLCKNNGHNVSYYVFTSVLVTEEGYNDYFSYDRYVSVQFYVF